MIELIMADSRAQPIPDLSRSNVKTRCSRAISRCLESSIACCRLQCSVSISAPCSFCRCLATGTSNCYDDALILLTSANQS